LMSSRISNTVEGNSMTPSTDASTGKTEAKSEAKAQRSLRQSASLAIVGCAAMLTGLGLLAIYASSSMKGVQQFGDSLAFFRKQSIVAVAGFIGIFIIQRIPWRWMESLTLPAYTFAAGTLALIFVPGAYSVGGGAARWLHFGGVSFQPAEMAKLALIMFLAKNLSRPSCNLQRFWTGVFPNLAAFGFLALCLMKQPDFGSTVLMGSLTVVMLFVGGLPFRYLAMMAGAGIAGMVAAITAAPYRMARLLSFLDPWAEVRGGGFQIIQSYLAFKNGGLLGTGLGESRQKLFFLPEAHTDFILSVIGEELGLLGILLVSGLFLFMSLISLEIARRQESRYRALLAVGCTALIFGQSALNMGVTMGLLPTKGMPLPFVSSGASSLLVFLAVTGILARLARESKAPGQVRQAQESGIAHGGRPVVQVA
jgi:cell division protein FtsW